MHVYLEILLAIGVLDDGDHQIIIIIQALCVRTPSLLNS